MAYVNDSINLNIIFQQDGLLPGTHSVDQASLRDSPVSGSECCD